ncbi:hypothetical protein Bpfe_013052 [Biomphalaria pfeifferi]|uniref:Uncharacterized protein n=1 Tax=Biomphalaria pfeifferi TaxID=112525 RepID=A0AAD8BPP7_BIOPF|nr:hypothetical protein Bpfe_013052 [Biomphalaria pfeifferi]
MDKVRSASKPVALDLKDLCLSAGAHERNSKLDNRIQKFSMTCTCDRECGSQENNQQRICTSAIIIDIGIDECQSIQAKSELTRGTHLQLELEETSLPDVRLLAEDNRGASDFVCNVAACEPGVPLRGVCREGLLIQCVRSTAVLKKTGLDTISLCAKRPGYRPKNSQVNRKRRRGLPKKQVQMTSWGTQFSSYQFRLGSGRGDVRPRRDLNGRMC